MSNKLSALLRVGVSFESSILCMGELFTVRDLENERV